MKSLLVTGGASGIGFEVVKLFLSQGYRVGAFDLNLETLQQLQKEGASELFVYKCDVTDFTQVKSCVNQFANECNGIIDIVHANAGILVNGLFKDTDASKYALMTSINALGSVYLAKATLPYLLKSDCASLVFTSSASAITGLPLYSVYGATKGFVTTFAESLSLELDDDNIYVGVIEPGIVDTAMTSSKNKDIVNANTESQLGPKDISQVLLDAITSRDTLYWRVGEDAKGLANAIQSIPFNQRKQFVKKMFAPKA